MFDFLKKSISLAFAITTAVFTFVPETFFMQHAFVSSTVFSEGSWLAANATAVNVFLCRVCVLLIAVMCSVVVRAARNALRRKVIIKGNNFIIEIAYGNLFKQKNCKKVISFDECYTTKVGEKPEEIKPTSICGQYLSMHPEINMPELLCRANLKPLKHKSKHNRRDCYESGRLIPYGDDLLLAFAKLDEEGRGQFFSREEYLESLEILWQEIDKHYAQKDVCIPILGSGLTRFDSSAGASSSQQEMLDLIIGSYWLSSRKIKAPCKLRIICKRCEGFSLNNIAWLQQIGI